MEETAEKQDLRAILGGVDIFRPLREEELGLIASHSTAMEFREGVPVFAEGDPGDCLYIVISGSVGVEKISAEGVHKRIAMLIPGDCFGELDLLTNGSRTASAQAGADSVLLRFPLPGVPLDSVMEGHPAVAAKVLRAMLAVISGRTRNANALIKENSPLVQELRQQVYGDKLSGLNNRTWLEETLPSLCGNPESPFALLMLKPDNFKVVNDTYGHEAGDRVIILMASELKKYADSGASCPALPFRFAGNEVGYILKGLGKEAALKEAVSIREKLVALDLSPVVPDPSLFNPGLKLSISIGIALFPEHGRTFDLLIAAVNELPLAGRNLGGNRILFPGDAI